jgi:GntR family transcriptional regulator/MocR family aminotransferase
LTQLLAMQLRAAIRIGALAHDAALPSTRLLASMLGVSRHTVVIACELLAAEGVVSRATDTSRRAVGFVLS